MGIFDNIKSGISSVTGLTQSDPTSGFKLTQKTQGTSIDIVNANATQLPGSQNTWGGEALSDAVKAQLQNAQDAQIAQNVKNQDAQALLQGGGGNLYGIERKPWIFASFRDIANSPTQSAVDASLLAGNFTTNANSNVILWYANPKSVDWAISQRGSESKTKSGSVLHIWRDRLRGTDFDDPKITMSFQTGSIHPMPTNLGGGTNVPAGLNNFYQFLSLVDQTKITGGHANLIHILYRSRIFPSMLVSGFFDPSSVVKFTDSTDSGLQVSGWSATFTIYKTVPAYNSVTELVKRFQTDLASDPLNKSGKK